MQNDIATVEDTLAVSIRVNILLSYDPAIIHYGIYSKGFKIYVHTKTYTWMFIEALYMIVKT